MTNSDILDIIIVGGGPTGINCGIACKKANLSFKILEKGVLVNSIYNFPVNMTFFSTSKKLEIGEVPFISHNEKPTRMEALEYYRRLLESYDLHISLGTAVLSVKKVDEIFEVITDSEILKAKNIILATGFFDTPRLLNIPGEDLPKVKHYYDDVHLYVKKKVVVVGGANSACDVALECWQKGAEVTMVVREKELYQNVKYWILPNIENRIKEGSIKAHFESELEEILPDKVVVKTPKGTLRIENDYVLAMTGYRPHLEWFQQLGIEIDEVSGVPKIDESTLETNVKGLYMAGVIVGGNKTSTYFIENTREHPSIIIADITSKKINK